MDNLILLTDGYKLAHYALYPPRTTKICSYFESRGGSYDDIVFFGLQGIIKKRLEGVVITHEKIEEAKQMCQGLPDFGVPSLFNESDWRYIVEEHGGRLPIRIRAVPEGNVYPTKNVLITVENTDPKLPWLGSYIEGLIVQVWYPMTVATRSWHIKRTLVQYFDETVDLNCCGPFDKPGMGDYGFRGVSSSESAGLAGAAHLISFDGGDSLQGRCLANKYYAGNTTFPTIFAGAEHSTMTTWGKEGEEKATEAVLTAKGALGVSPVCDSFDLFNSIENIICKQLKPLLRERGEKGVHMIIRLDSGDPADMVLKVLNLLEEKYGGIIVNDKGYKQLPSYLKLLQGDGINEHSLKVVLEAMKVNGWAASNVCFGSGGGLMQELNRDTLKCAFKASYAEVNGEPRNVFKAPVTDPGKTSKKGRLALVKLQGEWKTIQEVKDENEIEVENELKVVFENGRLLVDQSFADIRKRAEEALQRKKGQV